MGGDSFPPFYRFFPIILFLLLEMDEAHGIHISDAKVNSFNIENDEGWICSRCTFRNPPEIDVCEICTTPICSSSACSSGEVLIDETAYTCSWLPRNVRPRCKRSSKRRRMTYSQWVECLEAIYAELGGLDSIDNSTWVHTGNGFRSRKDGLRCMHGRANPPLVRQAIKICGIKSTDCFIDVGSGIE